MGKRCLPIGKRASVTTTMAKVLLRLISTRLNWLLQTWDLPRIPERNKNASEIEVSFFRQNECCSSRLQIKEKKGLLLVFPVKVYGQVSLMFILLWKLSSLVKFLDTAHPCSCWQHITQAKPLSPRVWN